MQLPAWEGRSGGRGDQRLGADISGPTLPTSACRMAPLDPQAPPGRGLHGTTDIYTVRRHRFCSAPAERAGGRRAGGRRAGAGERLRPLDARRRRPPRLKRRGLAA